MRKLYVLLIVLFIGVAIRAQVSVTATAGTAGPTSYATLSAAFAAINAGTHQGVIAISITANTTEPAAPTALLKSASPSSYSAISIAPSGGNWTISSAATPTANRGVVELNGADNVTIDGDDPGIAGAQNLTIQVATNSSTGTAAVRLSSNSTTGADGADNNTVKNCIIIGGRSSATSTTASYGINMSNYSTTSMTTGAYSSLNTRIENNIIRRCYHGVYANGASATYLNTGTIITGNTLGSSTSAENIGNRGILITYSASTAGSGSALIERNDIRAGDYSATGYSASIAGIEIGTVNAGCIVRRNNIHDVYQQSTAGYGAFGIYITGSTSNAGITIENNFIRDIVASKYSTSLTSLFENYGIHISAGATGIKINYNTIALLAPNTTGTVVNSTSACITSTASGVTITEFQNNILVNNNSSTQAFGFYTTATTNISAGTVNNNNYYIPNGSVGYYNGAIQATLDNWKAVTTKDGSSKNVNPPFASSNDLHIPNGSATQLESGGAVIPSTTIDYDNETRPGPTNANGGGTAPDIGADEFDGVPVVVNPCTTPTDQPTGLTFGTSTATTQPGSFTAATSVPSGYLVVRSSGALNTTPVDGTPYATGATLGNGTIVQSGTGVNFTATGLTGNTTYTYTIFAYNSGSCTGGPKYNTTTPLASSATTCAPLPGAITTANITTTSFDLNWTSSIGGGASPISYTIEVATDNAFTAPIAGSPFTVNDPTVTLTVTGLNNSTLYYYRIRANGSCNSAFSSTGSVTTVCPAETVPTSVQTFSSYVPICWSEATGTLSASTTLSGTTSAWAAESGFANTGSNAAVRINLYGTKNDWLISRQVDLGAGTNLEVKYRMAVTSYLGTASQATLGTHKVDLVVSTDGGATWSNANIIKSYTGTGTYSNTGQNEVITLSGFSGVVRFAFVATTTSTSPDIDFHIDDFSVEPVATTPCVAPTDQPTGLSFGTQGTTSQTGSFTPAASAPTGYLIVRSVGGLNTTPVNTTTYATGATLGNGTVVQSSTSTNFTATGLTGNTNYTYTVFAYNNTVCLGGPVYNSTSPLTGNSTTCPATPSSVTVSNSTSTVFRLNWNSSKGGNILTPITYTIDVSTENTFTTGVVTGSPFTINDSTTSQNTMRFLVTGLSPTTLYYYRIKASGCNATYSSTSSTTTLGPPPANDEASGAIVLTVGAGCTGAAYSNVNSTFSANEVYPSCSGSGQSPVWFSFVAPASGAVRVSTDVGASPTFTDSKVGLFSATNVNDYSTFGIISCDDDGGSVIGSGFLSVVYATGLTPGTTYYVAVDKYSSSTTAGTFCISVDELAAGMLSTANTCSGTFQTPVANSVTNYNAWVPLLDGSSKLIALVRNSAGGDGSLYTVKQNVNGGAVRQNAGIYYLNRNYMINNSTATNVNIQFFFLDTELAALNAVNGATINTLGVVKQTNGNVAANCYNNFATANGSSSLLPQTGNGSAGGVSWIHVTTPSFSNFYIQAAGGAILPANLVTFSGQRVGNANHLKWTVAQEIDVKSYEVERSEDGRTWNKAGSVVSLGNTSSQRSYGFTDNNINGIKQYYRLRQVDRNGSEKLSNIVVITGIKPTMLTLNGLFPNPAITKVNMLIDAPVKDNVTIVVLDAVGRVVKAQKGLVEAGSNTLQLNVAGLSQGSYLVKITCESNNETAVSKFIKE